MPGVGRLEGGGERAHAKSEPRLVNAAREFEAQMMKELMQPITRCDESDDASGSSGALTSLAGEMLGQSLSRAGGFGIGSRIIASLSQNETSSPTSSGIGSLRDIRATGLK